MLLATGTTVGRYAILSVLGEGGMGEVYLAQDARLGRRVALKVLRQDVESGEIAKRRFGQEAQTASALNHPNIVTIFDVGHADGLDFIAMEDVEGRTLREMLRDGRIEDRSGRRSSCWRRRRQAWQRPTTRTSSIATSNPRTRRWPGAALAEGSRLRCGEAG